MNSAEGTERRKPTQLDRALDLLREVRHQDAVMECAWESAEARQWIKETDDLLDEVEALTSSPEQEEGVTK